MKIIVILGTVFISTNLMAAKFPTGTFKCQYKYEHYVADLSIEVSEMGGLPYIKTEYAAKQDGEQEFGTSEGQGTFSERTLIKAGKRSKKISLVIKDAQQYGSYIEFNDDSRVRLFVTAANASCLVK